MRQKKLLPEQTLSPEKVKNRIRHYNWTYSQPPIVNAIKAPSRLGILLGFLSIPLVTTAYYSDIRGPFMDLIFTIFLSITVSNICPSIRKGEIKYTASAKRILHVWGILIAMLLLYSSIIRTISFIIVFIMDYHELGQKQLILSLFHVYFSNIPLKYWLATLTISLTPTVLMLFPREVNVIHFHEDLLEAYYGNTYKRTPDSPSVPLKKDEPFKVGHVFSSNPLPKPTYKPPVEKPKEEKPFNRDKYIDPQVEREMKYKGKQNQTQTDKRVQGQYIQPDSIESKIIKRTRRD